MSREPKPRHIVKDLYVPTGRGEYNVYTELMLWPDGTVTWRYKPGSSPKEIKKKNE